MKIFRKKHRYLLIILCLWLFLSYLLTYQHYSLPDLKDQSNGSGHIISSKTFTYTSPGDIPLSLRDLIVSIEDQRFSIHPGIDIIALARATRHNTTKPWKRQWASTIDQQLIKLQAQAYQRTRQQKISENRGALMLNSKYSKDDILLAYLNAIPFPYGYQGMEGGCHLYYDKACNQLLDQQLLFLIASAQLSANGFHQQDFFAIIKRRKQLCQSLYKRDPEVYQRCEGIDTASPKDIWDLSRYQAPQRQHLAHMEQQGYDLTALDFQLHEKIESIIATSYPARENVKAEDCCIIILDGEGKVRSLNVCRDRSNPIAGKVNTCLAKRQTWSAIKPFLYLYALPILWLAMQDTIVDEPVSFDGGGGTSYEPKNYDLTYHGELTLAEALASSLNIPAVKLLHQAWPRGFLSFLSEQRKLIWHDPKDIQADAEQFSVYKLWLSLALWTYEMSPLSFAQLRHIFALKTNPSQTKLKQDILTALSTAYLKVRWYGQDNYISPPGRATKTGTSRHFVDGRTCGMRLDDHLILCVRMGNHDAKRMEASGSTTAWFLRRLVVDVL